MYVASHCFLCYGQPLAPAWGAQGNPRELDIMLCEVSSTQGTRAMNADQGSGCSYCSGDITSMSLRHEARQSNGSRAGGAAKEGTGSMSPAPPSSPFRNIPFKALHSHQQVQRYCHVEAPSHHRDTSSPNQQKHEGAKSWKSFIKSTLAA